MRPLTRRHALAALAAGTAALAGPTATAAARPAPPAKVAPLGRDFLWGVASAGFQCEGHAPDSNWTRYVAKNAGYDPYRNAVDFYTRYAADIALAAGLGVNVYRVSIEWSRIQPRPGSWSEAGFAFYDRVLDTIAAHGMRPMLTLDHWVYPGWVADRGGWADPDMTARWLTNARKVVDRYASRNPLWITFNEPAFYIVNEVTNGGLSPDRVPLMQQQLARAHNSIYDHIHQRQPGARVTSNIAYILGTAEPVVNGPMLDAIAAKLDFIGIDYYYGYNPQSALTTSPADFKKLWNQPLQPEGIYYALEYYARRFPGKPLYIVENGMPTCNGQPRADHYTRADNLRDTVYWLQRAEADGMPLIGYNYWSITDNYEWGSYAPRFGLYTVDVLTDPALTRRRRARLFGDHSRRWRSRWIPAHPSPGRMRPRRRTHQLRRPGHCAALRHSPVPLPWRGTRRPRRERSLRPTATPRPHASPRHDGRTPARRPRSRPCATTFDPGNSC